MKIKKLILQTNALSELEGFYKNRMNFEISSSSANAFEIKIGASRLEFQKNNKNCYYHFAFNIPSLQSTEALNWLKERVAILPDENGNEIVDFINWNADAIYFFDPVFNEPEFIARKNLNIQSKKPFSSNSLLNISEIGLPVENVEETYHYLQGEITKTTKKEGLQKYWGDFDKFGAAGDEEGLFIIVDKEKKIWYPTSRPALAFPLEVFFEIEGVDFHLNYLEELTVKTLE